MSGHKTTARALAALAALCVLAGCTAPATPAPTQAPAAATPTVTAAPAVTASPTPVPTASPTPVPTPTPPRPRIGVERGLPAAPSNGVYTGESVKDGWAALNKFRFTTHFWTLTSAVGGVIYYSCPEWLLGMKLSADGASMSPFLVADLRAFTGEAKPDGVTSVSADGASIAYFGGGKLLLARENFAQAVTVDLAAKGARVSVSPDGLAAAVASEEHLALLIADKPKHTVFLGPNPADAVLGADGAFVMLMGGKVVFVETTDEGFVETGRAQGVLKDGARLISCEKTAALVQNGDALLRLAKDKPPVTFDIPALLPNPHFGRLILQPFDQGSKAIDAFTGEEHLLAVAPADALSLSPDGRRALGLFIDDYGKLNMVWVADGADVREMHAAFTDQTLYGVHYGAHFLPDGRLLALRHTVHRGSTSRATELEADLIDWEADTMTAVTVGP